jgi:uncharacterized protein (DUF2236 family)
MLSPIESLRRTLVREVRAKFNDQAKGERPVPASDDALYPRSSVVWRVHGDVTSMMVGGVAALLTQMLHPSALGGVWDHSDVAEDQIGRLRRTARFIAVTTYGERAAAEQAIARVRSIHQRVSGTLPDGTPYRADDPALLAWVHVAGAILFLDSWRRYADPRMSQADQDRYFAESALVAELLGADPVPTSRVQAERLIAEFRPQLRADERTRAFRRVVLESPSPTIREAAVQKLLLAAAVDLLPPFARKLHGLQRTPLPPVAVRGATFALAGALRWAFGTQSYRSR